MRVSLLGPMRIEDERGPVTIAAAKERSLLAALALSPGSVVTTDALLLALWGELPPATARKTLQTYVSNLRRALGPHRITTSPAGYALNADACDVDAVRFRALVRQGEAAFRTGAVDRARTLLAEACELWRGQPFADAAQHAGLADEAVRLGEEYWSAVEVRFAAELAAGRHALLIGELESLTRRQPLRERLWCHLMVALYRCGRQAEALDAFQRVRARLLDELGLEPGGELQRVQAAILAHDAALDVPEGAAPPGTPRASASDPVRRSAIRYAVCGDGVHVAYQVVGDGPVDILVIPGFVAHLDMWWDAPTDYLLRRLASIARLILFDKRGMGLSDRPEHVDVEHWVEDARAVLDAVGSERAAVLGVSAGGPTAALFAATYPQRVQALAVYGGHARALWAPDYEIGLARETLEGWTRHVQDGWGTGAGISVLAPSLRHDARAREFWARYQRLSASPGAAAAFLRALWEIDVRSVLPLIDVPTVVLHARDDRAMTVDHGRYLAGHIPGATLVELDTDVHLIWLSDRIDAITSAIESLLAEAVPRDEPQRVLATVVVVLPRERTGHWLRRFGEVVGRHRGQVQRTPGVATFDGPARAIRFAHELAASGREVGIGVHAGECQQAGGDLVGAAVDLAGGVAARAGTGEVLVTRTVRDLVAGSAIAFTPRGDIVVGQSAEAWEVFAAEPTG